MNRLQLVAIVLTFLTALAPAQANKNQVKGQGQVSGAYGTFGQTYTMVSGFNLTLYSAKCSVEPYVCYSNNGLWIPKADEKLVVLDFGVKNANPQDKDFGDGSGYFTLIDQSGEKYQSGGLAMESTKSKGVFLTLKPGQGAGTPELKDPLRVAFLVPLKSRIDKIIVNEGRKGKNEEVLRYLVAGNDPQADVKNIVKPLPEAVRDGSDKSGHVGKPAGDAAIGKPFVSGGYRYQVESIQKLEASTFANESVEEGKVVWTATVSITALGEGMALFDGQSDEVFLSDSDGERYSTRGYYKSKSDEVADSGRAMPTGEAYTVRLAFVLPKNADPKALTLRANGCIPYVIPVKQ